MTASKIKDFLFPLLTLGAILGISYMVISYGKGYRFDIFKKTVEPTGLIAATSDPTGSEVLVDNQLKTATNNTINVKPGWYDVTITKEGYQPWSKRLRVQGEVVTRADAYLFPANPSLSTLTTYGVIRPALSPDGTRLAYIVPQNGEATVSSKIIERPGIWIHDITNRPLSLSRAARQIARSSIIDFSEAVLTWSPDGRELVAALPNPLTQSYSFYLLDESRLNELPARVVDMDTLVSRWNILEQTEKSQQLLSLRPTLAASVSAMMKVISFSTEETKILYEASMSGALPRMIVPELIGTNPTTQIRDLEMGKIYVYDIKEDRNYLIGTAAELNIDPSNYLNTNQYEADSDSDLLLPSWWTKFTVYQAPQSIQWLPTDRHLILVSKDRIEAIDFDNTNRKTLYAGPFWDGFVVPWSNASRVLILTNLNPAAGVAPNLYSVNLR